MRRKALRISLFCIYYMGYKPPVHLMIGYKRGNPHLGFILNLCVVNLNPCFLQVYLLSLNFHRSNIYVDSFRLERYVFCLYFIFVFIFEIILGVQRAVSSAIEKENRLKKRIYLRNDAFLILCQSRVVLIMSIYCT